MSLAPSSDLVLEVERAADPARAAAVAARLEALSRGDSGATADFPAALRAAATAPARAAPAAGLPRSASAGTRLEAVVLTEFVSEMLPKDAQSAYGSGFAGDMWRSMLAERVADQLAASGRLGIAKRLFEREPTADAQDRHALTGALAPAA